MTLTERGNARGLHQRQPPDGASHPTRAGSDSFATTDGLIKADSKQNFIQEKPMTNGTLRGKRVAILVADGFEQAELIEPRKALDDAGATTQVVSPAKDQVKGWNHTDWGNQIPVDVPLDSAKEEDYNALLLPGGVMNPDRLRMNPKAVEFVKKFVAGGKPIAAICHGPWTLIEANAVRGHTLTSWPSLKTDLTNAGASWVDREVVTDGAL
jgi:protease I